MAKQGELADEPLGEIGTLPVCSKCGSERVVKDAFACWNPETGLWELENVFDHEHCHQCEGETTFRWQQAPDAGRAAVRELNDRFRTEGLGKGSLMITSGLQSLGQAFIRQAVDAVAAFDAFTAENDPWGEHDFGAVELKGEMVFWKIDCYALDLKHGSPNPANEAVTHRVLTIMLASEY